MSAVRLRRRHPAQRSCPQRGKAQQRARGALDLVDHAEANRPALDQDPNLRVAPRCRAQV